MQLQSQTHTYSRYNVLAQATQPMDVSDQLLSQLAVLSQQQQWILFTACSARVLILSNLLLLIFAVKTSFR